MSFEELSFMPYALNEACVLRGKNFTDQPVIEECQPEESRQSAILRVLTAADKETETKGVLGKMGIPLFPTALPKSIIKLETYQNEAEALAKIEDLLMLRKFFPTKNLVDFHTIIGNLSEADRKIMSKLNNIQIDAKMKVFVCIVQKFQPGMSVQWGLFQNKEKIKNFMDIVWQIIEERKKLVDFANRGNVLVDKDDDELKLVDLGLISIPEDADSIPQTTSEGIPIFHHTVCNLHKIMKQIGLNSKQKKFFDKYWNPEIQKRVSDIDSEIFDPTWQNG